MTVFEYQASRIERMAAALAHFVSTTAPDKLDWRVPLEGAETRTIMEMVSECAFGNRFNAALFRGESPSPPQNAHGEMPVSFADTAGALSQLIASSKELADAVRGLGEGDLEREFLHYRGPIKGGVLMELPYRNMAY